MQNFIGLYELLMPCKPLAPKCFHFQEITKTNIFGVPPNTLPYIGYVHNDNLPLGNIALQYMSFQTIAGRSDGVS